MAKIRGEQPRKKVKNGAGSMFKIKKGAGRWAAPPKRGSLLSTRLWPCKISNRCLAGVPIGMAWLILLSKSTLK